jgi:ABC-2 type transport system ATP-binding protein
VNDVSSPPELSKAQAAQLLAAMGAVRRVARRAVRTSVHDPLPPARSELLRLVARRPGIGVAEAAAELRLAPNSVSTMVSKLAEDGLLNRGRVASDGRSVRLTVTEAGAARINQWQDIRTDLAGRALDRLAPADRRALMAAIPVLTLLAEQMEELLSPGGHCAPGDTPRPRWPAPTDARPMANRRGDPPLTQTVDVVTTQAVDCVDLSYQFATHLAVDHVNLSIAPGEMYGLLGPNGAGKTTTIRMITTLLTPGTGSVRVFGIDAATRPMLVRRVIGYVPQALSADANLTGVENVELFARLFDVPRRERKQRVTDALDAMGLTEAAGRLAGTYSGGMIRRLELAQSLISAPRLLVLDEPTVGLDPIARGVVWEYIAMLRTEHQMTVLMTTHYMDEADAYCDRISLMHRGKIRVTGSPAELRAGLGDDATLDHVFRHYTGDTLDKAPEEGGIRDVRRTRRTARRLG